MRPSPAESIPAEPGPPAAVIESPAPEHRRERRRLIPVVPLTALTVIAVIVVASLLIELTVLPTVVNLPVLASLALRALAAAIGVGAGWCLWTLWRGRRVDQHSELADPAPASGAPVEAEPTATRRATSMTVGSGRSPGGANHSGISVAALVAGAAMCAPCAAVTPVLAMGWFQSLQLYPWYVQLSSTVFVIAITTLPVWALWRVGRLWYERYSTRLRGR